MKNFIFMFHHEQKPFIRNTVYVGLGVLLVFGLLYILKIGSLFPSSVNEIASQFLSFITAPYQIALTQLNGNILVALAVQILAMIIIALVMGIKNDKTTIKLKLICILIYIGLYAKFVFIL